jgi:lipoyl-dependent peroxiredoxin
MSEPVYTALAHVTGGRANGHGLTSDGGLEVDLRMPKELGGNGDGTNPEQLFAVGWVACFAAVLELVGRRRRLKADDAEIDSKVMLIPAGGGAFKLGAELDVTLPSIGDRDQAAELVREAHRNCPYSKATRGNIEVVLSVAGTRI